MKVKVSSIDYHVTNACNLSCEGCNHFSDLGLASAMVTPDGARAELARWDGRVSPNRLVILGGEPTLHPKLAEVLDAIGDLFTGSHKMLITNGFFIHRHPSLPDILKKHKIVLKISFHHTSPAYKSKEAEIRRIAYEWANGGVELATACSDSEWQKLIGFSNGKLIPCDGERVKSWQNCTSKFCLQAYGGFLWKCPQLAYFRDVEAKHGHQGDAWDSWREYKPLSIDCTDKELEEFVGRKDEAQCALCPSTKILYQLPDPIERKREMIKRGQGSNV